MILRFNIFLIILLLRTFLISAQNITLSKEFVKINGTEAHVASTPDTLVVNMSGFANNLRLVTTFPFELSIDGTNYNDSLIISNSQSNINIPVYIRTLPNQNEIVYRSTISFQDGIFSLNRKVYLLSISTPDSKVITTCSWNLKWFGAPTNCGCDTSLSRRNATSMLKEIDADVIALQEVVSIAQLEKMTADLGPKYSYVVSGYGSQITDTNAAGYANVQKLAYVFNNQKLTKQGVFGLLRSTYPVQQGNGSPYYYFASGRWPYTLSLKVNSTNEVFEFVNLHAKAFASSTDHNRRAGGAKIMTDSLNAHLPNAKIIILGDYNDLLEGATTNGFTTSPYDYLMDNGFKGITLPSQFPGETTYLGSTPSLIDNYVVSNEAYPSYIPNATVILREADFSIPNFKNTTSDHLPVLSFFRINTTTEISDQKIERSFSLVQPNQQELRIIVPELYSKQIKITIFSFDGKQIFQKTYNQTKRIVEQFPELQNGLYLVQIQSDQVHETHTWSIH